jgi:hypothetical protein
MGKEDIITKLQRELDRDIHEECQVIFILSRIRKILEVDKEEKKYKYLNFYCNLALHSQIDRNTRFVGEMLSALVNNNASGFYDFSYLYKDLREFCKEKNISNDKLLEEKNLMDFYRLLVGIYADTPIIFKDGDDRYKIVIRDGGDFDGIYYSLSCVIHKIS